MMKDLYNKLKALLGRRALLFGAGILVAAIGTLISYGAGNINEVEFNTFGKVMGVFLIASGSMFAVGSLLFKDEF